MGKFGEKPKLHPHLSTLLLKLIKKRSVRICFLHKKGGGG